jgi:hypothetical protein
LLLYIYIDQYTPILKMADEEVDWGVDEVLEANAVDTAIGTDDVLSLGGEEGSSNPISSSNNSFPASPPPAEKGADQSAPTIADDRLDENGKPLPAGWTKITSRTHGKVFYHNTSTKQTSWEIPSEATQPENVEEKEKDKEQKKEEPASTPSIAASSPRVAPSGPASWRSAQGQTPTQPQGRNRDREDDNRGDSKRTRLSSPPSSNTNSSNGNGNGTRFNSRAEPPRRTLFLIFPWISSRHFCSSALQRGKYGITCG